MPARQPLLIVITGPVGGGESCTGLALGKALRRFNQSVAVIDLDQVFGFVRQDHGADEELAWMPARAGAAALANQWFASGISVVIVEGEFFTSEELNGLLAPIPPSVTRRVFTLNVSYSRRC